MSSILSVDKFYSKPLKHDVNLRSKLDKLARIEASEEEKQYQVNFKLTGPSVSLREFPKQDDALQYAARDPDLSVFSWEVGARGQRKFLVCSKETFWAFYKKLEEKHYYEVIPWDKPCKLYFDLEFLLQHNPDCDGSVMTEALINIVNKHLHTAFSCTSFLEDVLILESSTETKFSIHLIFQKAIFSSNGHCGAFVKHLIASLSEEEKTQFEVKDHEENKTNFIDLSVYSRNRNFRLYLSTKYGKSARFRVSPLDIFSLALLERADPVEECEGEFHQKIFTSSLITSVEVDGSYSLLNFQEDSSRRSRARAAREVVRSCDPSPYPELEDLVTSLVSPGWVRQWRYCPHTDHLLFDIAGTRYCGNVRREHRSNHVYYTADLSRGVLWQGCHDQTCLGYRGEEVKIPPTLLAWVNMEDWSQEEEEEDMKDEDDELLLEASEGY